MNQLNRFYKQHPFLTILFAFQLFRLLLLPFFGMMPQDAYYDFYGEHLALSYFDHPGMIGYLLRLFTTVVHHCFRETRFRHQAGRFYRNQLNTFCIL